MLENAKENAQKAIGRTNGEKVISLGALIFLVIMFLLFMDDPGGTLGAIIKCLK